VDFGVPGMLLLLAAVGSTFLATWRARRAGHQGIVLVACEAVAVGMLTGAMFSDRLWSKSFWLVWILSTWAVYCEKPFEKDAGSSAPAVRR
jgi:hypothetical protein